DDGKDLICAECEYAIPTRAAWYRLLKNIQHEARKFQVLHWPAFLYNLRHLGASSTEKDDSGLDK
ncbi:MAG: hypothetical protein ABIH23_25535, partial [bacterium]